MYGMFWYHAVSEHIPQHTNKNIFRKKIRKNTEARESESIIKKEEGLYAQLICVYISSHYIM